jgi:hypothetical protein
MSKNHDMDEVPDGAWWFVYLILDLAVLALDVSVFFAVLFIEIACWIMVGGGDD